MTRVLVRKSLTSCLEYGRGEYKIGYTVLTISVWLTSRMRIDIDQRFGNENAIYLAQRLADAVKGLIV